MRLKDLLIGGIEAVYALFLGIIVVFISYKVFLKMTHTIDEEKELVQKRNVAISIALTSALITIGMIVKNILYPSIATSKLFIARNQFEFIAVMKFLGVLLAYFAICVLFAIGAVSLAAYLFTRLTKKIDEMNELKNDNVAVAILFAGVIFIVGYYLNEGVSAIVKSLIPYEVIPAIKQLR